MKQTSLILRGLFKQLLKSPVKQYYSQPHTIQSSVGIIFKFPAITQLESKEQFNSKIIQNPETQIDDAQMLFVQRAGYAADKNAYNVVFPGGQCDQKQSDRQACERQLKQEIGIQAQNQCIHLGSFFTIPLQVTYCGQSISGQFPSNFYYLKKRGKQVNISCHVYCLKSSSIDWQPKLNSEELRKFKWVNIKDLLKQENYHRRNEIKLGVFQRMPAFAAKIAKQNITKVTMQQLDLGMDRNLWGLTLYLWSYMLQMSLTSCSHQLKPQQVSTINGFIDSMLTFDLQFKPYSFYKYPTTMIASGWHYLYRVRPFTYRPVDKRVQMYQKILLVVFLIVVLNCCYALL